MCGVKNKALSFERPNIASRVEINKQEERTQVVILVTLKRVV